jgi:hypothetical protein
MKINISNTEKIRAAITKAEGGATTRLLEPEWLKKAATKAEEQLFLLRIPEKEWLGCKIRSNPEKIPNSYNYRAEGTNATLERFSTGWFLISVGRYQTVKFSYGHLRTDYLILSVAASAAMPVRWEL